MINFFVSPIGLGHATRAIAIAQQLDAPDIQFVSGIGAADLILRNGYSVLDLYRPEKFDVRSGQLKHSFRWLLDYYSYYRKCKAIAAGVLEKRDGLLVSDEDFASIAVGEQIRRKRILITDITESHFTTGAASLLENRMNKALKRMIEACDCVIIPEAGQDIGNLVHVGPVVRRASADRDTLRKQFGFSRKTIVVSVGGTDAGRFLIEKAHQACRTLGPRLDAELVIVSGPAFRIPDSPDYRNLGYVQNLHDLIYAADLVLSLAGRSTMDESIAFGTPGIFIPIKGHFEQEQGAKRLGFKFEDIFRLEELIEEKLGTARQSGSGAAGAEKAAAIISNMAAC